RGRRLDHVWVTPALKSNLQSASVFADARDWTKTSDHAPVVVDIDL
ncbi:MAG: exodeoxyribonuclease III, partial [Alphaproteobacteria bacterium]|nr:exodeoxyribonuclease III [Alphaproteobacteria bacterium]